MLSYRHLPMRKGRFSLSCVVWWHLPLKKKLPQKQRMRVGERVLYRAGAANKHRSIISDASEGLGAAGGIPALLRSGLCAVMELWNGASWYWCGSVALWKEWGTFGSVFTWGFEAAPMRGMQPGAKENYEVRWWNKVSGVSDVWSVRADCPGRYEWLPGAVILLLNRSS